MRITTTKFIRKALYVDAVRITGANFDEIAAWCQGEVQSDEVPGKGTTKKYIKVRVHNPKNARQTKAFIGDWLLYTERGYKVYTNKAFRASFDEAAQPFIEDPRDGDVLVIGPECFATGDGSVLSWRGVNYVPQDGTVFNDPEARVDIGGTITMIDESEALTVGVDEQPENEMPRVETTSFPVPETVETVAEQEKIEPVAAEGKRVLSISEQKELSSEEVRELVQSGEAVLAQDIAAA